MTWAALPALDGELALLLLALAPLAAAVALALVESHRLTSEGYRATLGWCVMGHLQALWRRRS